jgi:outer membrane protein OmpA-like peptidoglycan-associated protein
MKTWLILILIAGLAVTGCATHTGTGAGVGAGVGAAVGAGAGQAIGHSTEATLLGAGIGAVVGGLSGAAIGRYMDNQERSMRQAIADSEAATVRREQEIVQGAHKENVQVLTVSFKSDYLFATNSAVLLPGAQSEIQRVADVLRQYPETTIQVARPYE